MKAYKHSKGVGDEGFTIVELLIVIVIIGILAAITIVAYNGIQGRAYDASVETDLRNIAQQMDMFNAQNGVYPVGAADLSTLTIKVAKSAYAYNVFNGANAGKYDLLYCRLAASPNEFALIASSKSGNLFTYQSATGKVGLFTGVQSGGSTTMCQSVGINQTLSSDRDIFYVSGWASYVQG